MSSIYTRHPEILLSVTARVEAGPAQLDPACREALQALQIQAGEQAAFFRRAYVVPGGRAEVISLLNRGLLRARACFAPGQPEPQYARAESEAVTLACGASPALLKEYLVYDSFFRIYRAPSQRPEPFLASFLAAYQRVLLDAQYVELPADEFAHLLSLLAQALTICLDGAETLSDSALPAKRDSGTTLTDPSAAFAEYWQDRRGLSEHQELVDLALYRWFGGHQLWNAVLNLLCTQLDAAAGLALDEDESLIATRITAAADLIRGFTSLLWYTLSFPSQLYQTEISARMEAYSRAQGSKGLSGIKGQDFRQFRSCLSALWAALEAHYGSETTAWPTALAGAVRRLQHHEVLFHEHHIVLSNEKIAPGYRSILQRMSMSMSEQEHGAQVSALDAMRNLRELRRKQFFKL